MGRRGNMNENEGLGADLEGNGGAVVVRGVEEAAAKEKLVGDRSKSGVFEPTPKDK